MAVTGSDASPSASASEIYLVVKAPKEGSRPARKIYRVPDYINPEHEHFNAMELRLGLHTHASLETAQGGMDWFKVAVARMVVCGSDKPETASAASYPLGTARWADFVKDLELEGAQAMYEATPQHDPPKIPHPPRFLLALDALFLCAFLRSALEWNCWGYQFKRIFQDGWFAARRFPLYRDMMIMGNQVPMSLLLAVIKQLQKEEVSRKREKLADDDVTAVDTAHVDKEKESLLPDGDKQTLKKGEIELVVEDGDNDAPPMLNKLLVHLVANVYPFHGHKVKSWKQDFHGQCLSS